MKTRLVTSGALMCMALPASHLAVAQTALPDITVRASRSAEGASPALTTPNTAQATAEIQRTPGAVKVVPDSAFKNSPAQTITDMLGWVPGVLTAQRFGDDARVSIRGSGLSRNYGNRGVNMYMDGIPINTSDGLVDLFEIDPSAYRYVEVFKGANATRFGANSLGGAINFVTPTGHDAAKFEGRIDVGSFGYRKIQASTGGADDRIDYVITASAQRSDGYRDHSNGHEERASGNVGFRFSAEAETRFYVNANTIRQRLPGEVTKASALNTPKDADSYFELVDQQRNIDSVRLANKTTLRFGPTTLDFGVFGVHRHVMHPIYQWLDYRVDDHGGFMRATDDRLIGGARNRLVVGANVHNGAIDNEQFANLPGAVKGALAASTWDKSKNVSAYVENSFFIRPDVAIVGGTQFLHATRKRTDRFLANGDQSGSNSFDVWSPKIGVLWDVDPAWQVFANVSRSAEVPSFDVNSFSTAASSTVDAQTATTYEIGTRGQRRDFTWDVALYRAEIRNELQCLANPASPGACSVTNADRTVHQGIEAGGGVAVLKSMLAKDDRVWLNASVTYSDFRFDGDARYGDNRLPGAPRQNVKVEAMYKQPGGFYVGPSVEWIPHSYYADNANQVRVDGYSLLNLKIGFDDMRAGWSAYLEGRNLLDKRYVATVAVAETANAGSSLFVPGTGLAVFGGVRFTW